MDAAKQEKALRYSIIDGALSSVMDALVGGILLTGFALNVLNATVHQIGILASLPMFANLLQLLGAYIIERRGERRVFCFFTMLMGRILWVIVVLMPLAIFSPIADWRIWVLVAVVGSSFVFQALSGVAWLAWMSDLVPGKIRGTFFGKRNMVTSACGMAVVLLGGRFVTMWSDRFGASDPRSYMILFAIGVCFGVSAAWFLLKVPEADTYSHKENSAMSPAAFLGPLRDRNFRNLTLFVSAWTFAIQIAAPFYAVFMIKELKIDISTITVFTTFSTLATLFMMKIWGPISDKLGNKPVMLLSGWVLVGIPFIWIMLPQKGYIIPLLSAHILMGAFTAGAALSQCNIMIKLSPMQGRAVFLGLYSAVTGIIGATAPIIGGSISTYLKAFSFTFMGYAITNLHMVFFISAVLQALTVFFILKIEEPEAATPVAVIMQLRNDLNPQTGIGSATDFLMLEIEKTGGILKEIDDYTDRLAEKSEEKIKGLADRFWGFLERPARKIWDFFK